MSPEEVEWEGGPGTPGQDTGVLTAKLHIHLQHRSFCCEGYPNPIVCVPADVQQREKSSPMTKSLIFVFFMYKRHSSLCEKSQCWQTSTHILSSSFHSSRPTAKGQRAPQNFNTTCAPRRRRLKENQSIFHMHLLQLCSHIKHYQKVPETSSGTTTKEHCNMLDSRNPLRGNRANPNSSPTVHSLVKRSLKMPSKK